MYTVIGMRTYRLDWYLVKPKLKWVICDVSVMQVCVVHETPCERIVGHRSRDIVMVPKWEESKSYLLLIHVYDKWLLHETPCDGIVGHFILCLKHHVIILEYIFAIIKRVIHWNINRFNLQ